MLNIKNSKFLWLKNPEGFLNKKGSEMTIGQLISLILVILVIVVVLISILKPQIWEWVRALPDYKYDDSDKEIEYNELTDAQLAGVCPGASKVGSVGPLIGDIGFREQYIIFFVENQPKRTKLYWKGSETNARIWLYQKDKYTGWDWFKKDLLVATVDGKGVIKVKPELLDLDSEIYQKTRFETQVLELSLLPLLENAYLAFNNQICRVLEPAKLKSWPESEKGELEYIDSRLAVNSGELDIIGIYPYVNLKNSDVKFLYLENKKDFIQVNGYRDAWGIDRLAPDREDLFEIYPDDSIWFIEGNALYYRISILNTDKKVLSRKNPYLFIDAANRWYGLETNLRTDYDKIRKKVEYKEKTD